MDAQDLGCLAALLGVIGAIIAFVIAIALQSKRRAKELQDAWNAYQGSLEALKKRPDDPNLRQTALALGRAYSNLTRQRKGVTLYDEVALMNDLNAACAGGIQAQAAAAPAPTVEVRLSKLRALVESGHITDAEYQKRRQEILQSI